jgi:hypothetical protein
MHASVIASLASVAVRRTRRPASGLRRQKVDSAVRADLIAVRIRAEEDAP